MMSKDDNGEGGDELVQPVLFEGTEREWPPRWTPDNPAFEGLSAQLVEAITDPMITTEMVEVFVACLSPEPQKAEEVRRRLVARARWFPTSRRDTQLRFMRRLVAGAIVRGHPVCSLNSGYHLGTRADVVKTAERQRALARGAFARAVALERLARRMEG